MKITVPAYFVYSGFLLWWVYCFLLAFSFVHALEATNISSLEWPLVLSTCLQQACPSQDSGTAQSGYSLRPHSDARSVLSPPLIKVHELETLNSACSPVTLRSEEC